jgi:hypothetical protein
MVVTVKPMSGKPLDIYVSPSDSVAVLKTKVELASGIAAAEQCLTFKGKQLNEGSIDANQIKNKATILLRQVRPRVAAVAASTTSLSSEPATPPRPVCAAGCGYYGESSRDNLCSRCYENRETRRREEELERKKQEKERLDAEAARLAQEREANRPKQLKPTRCFKCNLRVGPAIIQCRCGYGFCASCRYPEQHNCTYDFKAHDAKILMEANPQIKADKMKDRT